MINDCGCTTCAAFLTRRSRSCNALYTSFMSPCPRYRTPPCINFVLLLEVPFAKSLCSKSTTDKPRNAASRATPNPVAPPPMMMISQESFFPSLSTRDALLNRLLPGIDAHLIQFNLKSAVGSRQWAINYINSITSFKRYIRDHFFHSLHIYILQFCYVFRRMK